MLENGGGHRKTMATRKPDFFSFLGVRISVADRYFRRRQGSSQSISTCDICDKTIVLAAIFLRAVFPLLVIGKICPRERETKSSEFAISQEVKTTATFLSLFLSQEDDDLWTCHFRESSAYSFHIFFRSCALHEDPPLAFWRTNSSSVLCLQPSRAPGHR